MRFVEGIHAQPDVLERSRRTVSAALDQLPAPDPTSVIALVGIGASEHAARSAAPEWRHAGLRAFPVSASELRDGQPGRADLYIAISQSGRSAETVAALGGLDPAQCIGITNEPAAPLGDLVGTVVPLGSGDDSPVYTTGYTATLQALGLLGERWTGRSTDWDTLPSLAADVLASLDGWVDEAAGHIQQAAVLDVVASGTSNATAGEGALLLRESARLRTATHETYNYLHGPMEPLDSSTGCLVIGDAREVQLAQDVSKLGCPTVLLTTRDDVTRTPELLVLTLPRVQSGLGQAVLEILPIQLIGWTIAQRRGLAVDGFRHRQHDTKLA